MTDHDFTAPPGVSRRGALHGLGVFVAAAGVAALQSEAAAAQDATPAGMPEAPADFEFKVVLHASQEQHWPYVISNLTNLTRQWPRARLRLVVDGSAVFPLQGENVVTTALDRLARAGVEVEICPNALAEHQIDPATIPSYARTELGGVVALVRAHQAGFVYVKP